MYLKSNYYFNMFTNNLMLINIFNLFVLKIENLYVIILLPIFVHILFVNYIRMFLKFIHTRIKIFNMNFYQNGT